MNDSPHHLLASRDPKPLPDCSQGDLSSSMKSAAVADIDHQEGEVGFRWQQNRVPLLVSQQGVADSASNSQHFFVVQDRCEFPERTTAR